MDGVYIWPPMGGDRSNKVKGKGKGTGLKGMMLGLWEWELRIIRGVYTKRSSMTINTYYKVKLNTINANNT